MSLWDRLYEAQRTHPHVLPRRVPVRSVTPGRGGTAWRVELSPELVRAIERVLERELSTFQASRAAGLAQTRMLALATARPPKHAPAAVSLPHRRRPTDAQAPRLAAPCAVCGGPVRVDRLDLDDGTVRFECRDCGRHWTEPAPVDPAPRFPARGGTDRSIDR